MKESLETPRVAVLFSGAALLAACSSVAVNLEAARSGAGSVQSLTIAPLVNRSENPHAAATMRALLAKAAQAEAGLRVVEMSPDTQIDP